MSKSKIPGRLQRNLFLWFVAMAALPVAVLISFTLPQANQVLKQDAARLLAQTAEAKAAFIESWFDYRFKDLDYQAQNTRNSQFMQELITGLRHSKKNSKDYIKSYKWVQIKTPYEESFLNLTRKYRYIYNVFFIDLSGNLLFTVTQENDLGTNILTGTYSQTLFASAVRETIGSGRSVFSGVERYAPSGDLLTGFLTSPLLDSEGEKLGVLAIQIKLDQLYGQVTPSQHSQHSQHSQQHYLVDRNGLLLSPINSTQQVLNETISSKAILKWQNKEPLNLTPLLPYQGPNQEPVFGYQTSIKIANTHWLLLSEIEKSEALQSSYFIQNMIYSLMAIVAFTSLFIAYFQAKRIVLPISQLTQASRAIAKGEQHQQVDVKRQDEIGELARNFNQMISIRDNDLTTIHKNNKKINQALTELSEQKFAIDQHAIVAITDLAGTITYANERFCKISGYSLDELIGHNHRLLNSGYHPRKFFEQMFDQLTQGNVWRSEICNQAKSGTLYWVDTTIVPIKDNSGDVNSYIAIRTDITHIKEIEKQLKKTVASVEAANIAKSEFLANMSHEIRTPLNGVIGMNSLLLSSGLNSEQKTQSKIVASSAGSLLTIINDILDFSKIEAGKLDFEIIDFDLANLIYDIGSAMSFKAEEKDIELICPATPLQSHWYRGDPGRIRQVLVNLIGNAIKFTNKGEVSVTVNVIELQGEQPHLLVEVIDSGIGLSSSQQKDLFERFTQADGSTTRKFGGTGLGLTISKQLVELMGGEINLESALNEGSTFSIAVPLEKSSVQAAPKASQSLNKESILIVDDNYTNRKLLSSLFDLWGLANQKVESGAEALQLMSKAASEGKPFSFVILDMQMPIMDGAELTKLIRQQADIADSKLLMLTSQASRGDAKKMKRLGINAFLTKPVNQSDLYNALLQVAGQGEDPRLITRHTARELHFYSAHVLIVEDNITNQLVAKGMLEKMGIKTSLADDGEKAIEALSKNQYDLVFMDCQMPIMDGYQATRVIRDPSSSVLQHDINIIAMTANVMAADKKRCFDAGMDNFIAKPVSISHLQSCLAKWLPNNKREDTSPPHSNDYQSQDDIAFDESKKIQKDPVKLAVFDPAVLQELLSDEEQIRSIIDAFISEMPIHLEQLNIKTTARDMPSVGTCIHKVKGAASSIGANTIAQIAKHMEMSANNGDNQELTEDLKNLTEAFKVFQETV